MQILIRECDEQQMQKLAEDLSALLKAGDCLTFHGDLGAGKTTFIRAVIQKMAGAQSVPSPTFTLVQHYDSPKGNLWHFDLYRLKTAEELYELGYEEALINSILFIEWPERAKGLLPPNQLQLHLDPAQDNQKRKVLMTGDDVWAQRLQPLTI